ncbi:gliding motility-associated C-terminal domain-containing protein [Chitinophaga solisilvae]|uniref:T9SS type B sorting domain-containing protein n=1 Tax=Chitinophaga solisilvae TaxID=1233460 RepID=UPI00136EA3A0|nr:gliding motility-associated C-terminal domain-containing protein [Chitinophaga solisilvae]
MLLWLSFLSLTDIHAQDVIIRNPSLEGKPKAATAPPEWTIAANSPDIQPGTCCNIMKPAVNGDTYIGLLATAEWDEGISQQLNGVLKAGITYALSFDMAFPVDYFKQKVCNGGLAIYAGNGSQAKGELLWKSPVFTHTEWKRYNIIFTPKADYHVFSLFSYHSSDCNNGRLAGILVDNLSASVLETPRLSLSSQNTCQGESTGIVRAAVTGGTGPCTYLWKPGGQTTSQVTHLPAGNYEVTATARNGTTSTGQITVMETILKNDILITPSRCSGDNNNEIALTTSGGTPPYHYFFNGGGHPTETPQFRKLRPGSYQVKVKDDPGCSVTLNDIRVVEPLPLQIAHQEVKDISCSDTRDGRISLAIAGGTMPYLFKLELGNWQSDNAWSQLNEGRYYFQVKDKNECEVRGNAEIIRNQRQCAVYVPTAFSPNSDGLNDVFRCRVNDDVRDFQLQVFNRWGAAVFRSSNPQDAWDGAQQPAGSYIWVLTYTDSRQQARKQQGSLTLIR